MKKDLKLIEKDNHRRLENAYRSEKPRFLSRLKAMGRTLEEAEDLIHDVYTETLEKLPLLSQISNLPAWINTIFKSRIIDAWRRDRYRVERGKTNVSKETLQSIVYTAGLDPVEAYVQDILVDALNTAIKALPALQRQVVEFQVFGGLTFREISEVTGENIDTLKARKRYALGKLARALRHWIDED